MNRRIAKSLVDSIKEKPRTRFELIELFGKHVGKTIDEQAKNGFIGKRRIVNTNSNVWATHVLEFYFIKDYFDPREKPTEKAFKNRQTIYLNDSQLSTFNSLGGYQWLRSFLDGVD